MNEKNMDGRNATWEKVIIDFARIANSYNSFNSMKKNMNENNMDEKNMDEKNEFRNKISPIPNLRG